jgi:hypothetical protein
VNHLNPEEKWYVECDKRELGMNKKIIKIPGKGLVIKKIDNLNEYEIGDLYIELILLWSFDGDNNLDHNAEKESIEKKNVLRIEREIMENIRETYERYIPEYLEKI